MNQLNLLTRVALPHPRGTAWPLAAFPCQARRKARWARTDRQPACSSFSGLLLLSFPLEIPVGTDPAVYSTYCHFSHKELTRRSRRICWRYGYSTNPFQHQQPRPVGSGAPGNGARCGSLGKAAAVMGTPSPSRSPAEMGVFGL